MTWATTTLTRAGKLDRLGRRVKQLVDLVGELQQQGVQLGFGEQWNSQPT